jgi:hypothetical protein
MFQFELGDKINLLLNILEGLRAMKNENNFVELSTLNMAQLLEEYKRIDKIIADRGAEYIDYITKGVARENLKEQEKEFEEITEYKVTVAIEIANRLTNISYR